MKKWISLFLVLSLLFALCVLGYAESGEILPTDPIIEPVTDPVAEPATDPVTEPATDPTNPETDPTNPETDPTNPETDPTNPETDPTNPETDPTNPETDPTNPETDPTDPVTDPTNPVDPGTTPTTPTTPNTSTNPVVTPTIPVATGYPTVTKHPSGESVTEDGYAEFVARATNATQIIWLLSNPSGSIEIQAERAPDRFPGLVVTGLNSERLGLDHIPVSMTEWRVRAQFVGSSGSVYSEYAVLNVKAKAITSPTITQQPTDITMWDNLSASLQVVASTSEAGATLSYQWYMNSANSNVGGKVIYAATSATYVPEYIPGTTYYYCAVRTVDGTNFSLPTKTQCAAVTYNRSTVTEPTQAPATQSPTQDVSGEDTPVWATATEDTQPISEASPIGLKRSNSLLMLVIIVIAFIVLLGILATILILKFYPRDNDEYEEEEPVRVPPKKQAKKSRFDLDETAVTPVIPKASDPEWDDLSDLGDLSIYFEDEDEFKL